MATLDDEIAAFQRMQPELEERHMNKWVLIHQGQLIGTFESFEVAAQEAVRKFGRGPYLIRQVGAADITLPASVMYHPVHGGDKMRVRR